MTYVFALDHEQFYSKLQQTVFSSDFYHLEWEDSDRKSFSVFIPSKAVVIAGRITSATGRTELFISATSPICVISSEFEQKILTELTSDLEKSLQQPAPWRKGTNRPHFFAFFHKLKNQPG